MIVSFSDKHSVKSQPIISGKMQELSMNIIAISQNYSPLMLKERNKDALKISLGLENYPNIWKKDDWGDTYNVVPSQSVVVFTQNSIE